MIGAGFLDRLRLGALDEARIAEALRQGVPLLFRSLDRLGKAGALGLDVDHAFERQHECGFVNDDLRGSAGGSIAAATDSALFTVPADYRPANALSAYLNAYGSIGNAMRCYLDGATGAVTLSDKAVSFATGANLSIDPTMWPSN